MGYGNELPRHAGHELAEPLGRGGGHGETEEEAKGVDDVAGGSGNDGEGWIGALAPSGEEEEDDVGEGCAVPGDKGPAGVEDAAVFAEEDGEKEDEETAGESSHGEDGVGDEAVGEFEAVEDAGEEQDVAGGHEQRPPGESGDAPEAGDAGPFEGMEVG